MVFVAQYVPLDFKDAAIELAEYCLAFEIRRKSAVFLNSSLFLILYLWMAIIQNAVDVVSEYAKIKVA